MPKTVLITGASSGLGLELARVFAANRHNLLLVARRKERLEKLSQEIAHKGKGDVRIFAKDLSRPQAPAEIAQELTDSGLSVDILVNNAGFGTFGAFASVKFPRIREMMQVNVIAMMELCRLIIPGMRKRGNGHILNVASMAAFLPGPLEAEYFATKACILSFSKSLAYELRDSGVSVSTFCPGRFRSEFQENIFEGNHRQNRYGRMPSAADMAQSAYAGMKKRRPIIIPGFSNHAIYLFQRIIPSSWLARAVCRSLLNDLK